MTSVARTWKYLLPVLELAFPKLLFCAASLLVPPAGMY